MVRGSGEGEWCEEGWDSSIYSDHSEILLT